MLIRLRPPGYQVSLWLFLQNSALGRVERVERDAIRVTGADDVRLAEAIEVWKNLNALAEVEFDRDP
jgi:hypothetical protein